MKISELINQLSEIKWKHGDIKVKFRTNENGWTRNCLIYKIEYNLPDEFPEDQDDEDYVVLF